MVTTCTYRPVWWRSMHAISNYHGNRHRLPARPLHTHRQDRLQYTAPQLASAQCNHGNHSIDYFLVILHPRWCYVADGWTRYFILQHGGDSAQPLCYTHIDIAGSSGPFPGVPTGSPLVAMAHAFVLSRESAAKWCRTLLKTVLLKLVYSDCYFVHISVL